MHAKRCKYLFKNLIIYFSFVLLFGGFAYVAHAAELSLVPGSSAVPLGDIIQVRVVLLSADQPANAVSGVVSFPKELLTLNSVSKSNSIVSVWPVEPSYSNAQGTVNFDGVMLSGYQGKNGTILTLSFKAKATGNANIKFSTASVLAHDGAGTLILSATNQTTVAIGNAKATPAPTTDTIKKPEVTDVAKPATPTVTDYSNNVKENDFIVVKGTVDPLNYVIINSDVLVSNSNNSFHESVTIRSDDKGSFTYVSENRANRGIYAITAIARTPNGVESAMTPVIIIDVQSDTKSLFGKMTSIYSLMIPAIALFALFVIIIVYSWYRIAHYRERMRKRLLETRALVDRSFSVLGEDVEKEAKILQASKALKLLTQEERNLVNQFKKDITATEQAILDDMKNSDKEI